MQHSASRKPSIAVRARVGKWLPYRDRSILDRPLTCEEVAHVQATARRLAAILLTRPDLYGSVRAAAYAPLA
jgi:hypothetical protein